MVHLAILHGRVCHRHGAGALLTYPITPPHPPFFFCWHLVMVGGSPTKIQSIPIDVQTDTYIDWDYKVALLVISGYTSTTYLV